MNKAIVYATVLDYSSNSIAVLKHEFDDVVWGDITNEQVQEWLESEGKYREDTCYFMFSNRMPDLWNETGEEFI